MTTAGAVNTRPGLTAYEPREGGPCFLSDMIIELGMVEEQHVAAAVEAARASGETVGHILVADGRLTDDQLARALAARYGLNHVDLSEFDVNPDAANLLAPPAAKRYGAVPVSFEPDGSVLVAMADPSDSLAITDIAFMTKLEVSAAVASESLLAQLVARLPLPPGEGSGARFPVAAPPQPEPAAAPEPEAVRGPEGDHELAALRAEIEELNLALDSERSRHAQSVAELRAQLAGEERLRAEVDGLHAELEEARRAAASAASQTDLAEAERRVGQAHATVEKMRRDFELEGEQHAAKERELRALLASETERHGALEAAHAALQKRLDGLRTQNAALLDAYATAKRWSAEFARGARELTATLEQPVLDDALRAKQADGQ